MLHYQNVMYYKQEQCLYMYVRLLHIYAQLKRMGFVRNQVNVCAGKDTLDLCAKVLFYNNNNYYTIINIFLFMKCS